jgi:8-hydroxy-5-deazaflavin:NADPH oxidoreductase
MHNFRLTISRRHILGLALGLTCSKLSFAAGAPKPKIGIIGAGRMGGALGSALAKAGYPVMFSSRNPAELKDLVAGAGANAQAGTVEQAAAFGDIAVLVVPYSAMPDVAKQVGPVLAAKPLLLDVSNPIPQRDGDEAGKALEEGPAAYLSRLMPGVKIVRGFNSISFARIPNPVLPNGGKLGVAMVGEDAKAVEIATTLARDIGFEPVVIGPLNLGKYLYRPSTYFNGSQGADEIRAIAKTIAK